MNKKVCIICGLVMAFCVGFLVNNADVGALSDYGNVMSDFVMRDYNSMSISEIQSFLTSVNSCDDTNYDKYAYLNSTLPYHWHWANGHFVCMSEERFEVAQPTKSWSETWQVWYDDFTSATRFGDYLEPGEGMTAAEIIYTAAHDYEINPKVIMTFLQKEQGLITDPIPMNWDYNVAMGYNCPDSGNCPVDERDKGFSTQVFHMARRLEEYLDGDLNYWPGNTYNFDGYSVYIQNTATAALYTYTPHVSDKVNLARIYEGWFGDIIETDGIENFYAKLGGEESYLGNKIGQKECGLARSGCKQQYEIGYIYWAPHTGAWDVSGGILTRWSAIGGENSIVGYPISTEKRGLVRGGVYQAFERGNIY